MSAARYVGWGTSVSLHDLYGLLEVIEVAVNVCQRLLQVQLCLLRIWGARVVLHAPRVELGGGGAKRLLHRPLH